MSSLQRLDGDAFAQLVYAGHDRLKRYADVVNSLNVFPVPDGDTGTNMEMSLAAGVSRLRERTDRSLFGAAQALATGLLMGARGNSGVILSQLFRGFLKTAGHTSELDTNDMAASLQEGVAIAYRAVAKPVEGTILTVAREAAAVGLREAKRESDLALWMAHVCTAAREALAHTPEQLSVLKQAGVVDSGGQGLVYIYDGFLSWLQGDRTTGAALVSQNNEDSQPTLDFAAAHIDHEGEYGYCTEVLLRVEEARAGVAEAELRMVLGAYGDSLLAVSAGDLVKVHVHTLHPGRVLEDALQLGSLVAVKVDNMTDQHSDLKSTAAPGQSVPREERSDEPAAAGLAVLAVVAGDGLQQVFKSLGAAVVISGGQTMNPSTEEIVSAIRSAGAEQTIVLPNNHNIIMTANQAKDVFGEGVWVVPTRSIPEGIAALMAYRPSDRAQTNAERMSQAAQAVHSGQVVRSVRDSVYQGQVIREGQYLGLVDQDLTEVGDERLTVALHVIDNMGAEGAELLTIFYGSGVSEPEVRELSTRVEKEYGIEVEFREGGQPVYDYIFSLE